jgi:small-conductance mechanosensitive channel
VDGYCNLESALWPSIRAEVENTLIVPDWIWVLRSFKILIFARASWRRKSDEGPGWDQNVLGSGKVGRIGTAIVVVAVVVVVTAAALVDSTISSTQLLSYVQVGYIQVDIGE